MVDRTEIAKSFRDFVCICKKRSDGEKVRYTHSKACDKAVLEAKDGLSKIVDLYCQVVEGREQLERELDGAKKDERPVVLQIPQDFRGAWLPSELCRPKDPHELLMDAVLGACGGRRVENLGGSWSARHLDGDAIKRGFPERLEWTKEELGAFGKHSHWSEDRWGGHAIFPQRRRALAYKRAVCTIYLLNQMCHATGKLEGTRIVGQLASGETTVNQFETLGEKLQMDALKKAKALLDWVNGVKPEDDATSVDAVLKRTTQDAEESSDG